MASFFDLLEARVASANSLLCVGLDPHASDLSAQTGEAAYEFCDKIISATHHVAAAFKPNAAFFEALGPEGVSALHRVVARVPAGIPVLLDCKRGDIGSTAAAYATAAFQSCNAHAVTVAPYMGYDSVEPFVKDTSRGAFLLCKTSNPSSADFETLAVAGAGEDTEPKPLYQVVAEMAQRWNTGNNIGLVVGATDVKALRVVRRAVPRMWILAPGVGFQGGNLEEAVAASLRQDGMGLLLPVSRGISRSEDPRAAAENFCALINEVRAKASTGIQGYQRKFFKLALECGVLKFGSFTLKSGRISPYFFNAGLFNTGRALTELGRFYAESIQRSGIEFDVIFGPAYKGIPLAASIAVSLYSDHGRDTAFAYNRKEAKDHGEGGVIVGASLNGKRVLVVDDVISAGTAIRESMRILDAHDASPTGVVVALDRQSVFSERKIHPSDPNPWSAPPMKRVTPLTQRPIPIFPHLGSPISAIQSVEAEFKIPVVSVARLEHLFLYVKEQGSAVDSGTLESIAAYRERYGVA